MGTMKNRDEFIALVVEDNFSNYEIAKSFLNEMGVCCENAFDGIEAIEMCRDRGTGYYSLILMDINLPRLNGIQTTKRIRSITGKTPVIAMTAYSKDSHFMNLAYDMFDAVISKPFSYAKFNAVISPYIPVGTSKDPERAVCSTGPAAADPAGINANVCDVTQGISNMGGNADLFIKHFNNFKYNNVDLAVRLRNHIDGKQYREAATLCHSTKGVSGMLALSDIYNEVIDLESVLTDKTSLTEDEARITDDLLSSISDSIRQICMIRL